MNKRGRIALLVAGPTRPDLLVGVPALAKRLGPVAARSYQHASRVVNALRHGEPARTQDPLREAKVILCAGAPAPQMAEDLHRIERPWRGALVIFAGPPDPDPAPGLVELGARVATATLVPSSRNPPFCVVAGSAEAAKLLRSCGARVLRAAKGPAREYHHATVLLENLLPQLLESAAARLKSAGLSPADTRTVLAEQTALIARAYLRTRKRPAIAEELEALATRIVSGGAVP